MTCPTCDDTGYAIGAGTACLCGTLTIRALRAQIDRLTLQRDGLQLDNDRLRAEVTRWRRADAARWRGQSTREDEVDEARFGEGAMDEGRQATDG